MKIQTEKGIHQAKFTGPSKTVGSRVPGLMVAGPEQPSIFAIVSRYDLKEPRSPWNWRFPGRSLQRTPDMSCPSQSHITTEASDAKATTRAPWHPSHLALSPLNQGSHCGRYLEPATLSLREADF